VAYHSLAALPLLLFLRAPARKPAAVSVVMD